MSLTQDILNKLNEDIIIEIMEENGSPVRSSSTDGRTGQKCLWFTTICHGGDSGKLCYFTETKTFYCYTNCGFMNVFELIKKIRNLDSEDFAGALRYLANKVGVSFRREGFYQDDPAEGVKKELEEIKKEMADNPYFGVFSAENKIYDEKILDYFDENTFYTGWNEEGITDETMRKFGIRYYWDENHIIIPHYNINGELIGVRRRSLNPEDSNNKYMPEFLAGKSYEHSLGLNLYGLNINKEEIQKQGRAILVEGEKSVMLSDSFFDKSVTVATCGFNVSEPQIHLLDSLGVRDVYLGFDKDYDPIKDAGTPEYEVYAKKIKTLCKRLLKNFNVYLIEDKYNILGKKDSPFDKGKENFEYLYQKAERIHYIWDKEQ